MLATEITRDRLEPASCDKRKRFDRVTISSVWGEPLNPATWSGAPYRIAGALARLGIEVNGFHPKMDGVSKYLFAARHLVNGYGKLVTNEQIRRGPAARQHHALQLAEMAARTGTRAILHVGTFDLPPCDLLGSVKHYLYCDQTWWLSLQHRTDIDAMTDRARDEYELLEHRSFEQVEHIFTFGKYVRDDIVEHYGVPASRVTVAGSGMGAIEPYFGPKSYETPNLLFVAKHLFTEKGGELLLDAFFKALPFRENLRLTIVGDRRSAAKIPKHRAIDFQAKLSWEALTALYRKSTLLVQPMLNDPWGQVYLEALASRTPVLGLDRNGLPEIIEGGRHGFLISDEDPDALAAAILDATSDPSRLAVMGQTGQRHVLDSYSWDIAAERIAFA